MMGFAKRYAPKWLVPALTVCAFIPGPLDEIAVVAVVLYPVLKSHKRRQEFRQIVSIAWSK